MARMNVQKCNQCGKLISGEYRMKLMMGPKGYRQYAVCASHVGAAARPSTALRSAQDGGGS